MHRVNMMLCNNEHNHWTICTYFISLQLQCKSQVAVAQMHWYKFAHLSKIILNNRYLFLYNHRSLNIIQWAADTFQTFSTWSLSSGLLPWQPELHFVASPYMTSVSVRRQNIILVAATESVWILRLFNTEEQRAHTLRAEQSISFSLISFRKLSRSRLCLSMESFKLSTTFCLSRKSRSTN